MASSVDRRLTVSNVTAAGTAQANATVLLTELAVVAGADGAKGVVLPAAPNCGGVGLMAVVVNTTAGQNLKIYPPVNGAIDFGLANAPVTLAGQKTQQFWCVTPNQWYSTLTA
jgi:hypothetical protein